MTTASARTPNEKEEGNKQTGLHDGEALGQLATISTNASYRPPEMSPARRRAVMFTLCMTLLLSALDITIIATALPTIASTLHATSSEYAWVGSAYTLSSTASTPVWAKMSDIFGRKLTIMVATAVFMAGSLIAALAQTIYVLIAGRTVQGLGGGGSLVLVTIVIGDIFKLEDRAKYYGMTGIVWGLAGAVGPILGGVFTETIGWRWCFFINLPFDGVALLVLFFALKLETPKEAFSKGLRELDWVGFVLIIGGTICFLYGLETGAGGVVPWGSAQVICLILFGVITLALFVFWEARFARNPVIPFRIFKKGSNIAAFVVACLHAFVFISYDYFLPLYFQVVLGFRPIISGVSIFPLLIPLTMMTMLGGLFTRKTGNYIIPIFFGSAMMTLGNGLFISFQANTQWAKIVIFQIITGFGAGVLFQSPMISIQTHTHQRDMAAAMSAFSFLRSLFTSMSVVIGTVLLQHNLGGGGLTGGNLHAGDQASTAPPVDKENYISALHIMWAFFTGVSGCMLFTAVFIKQKPKKLASETGVEQDSVTE
ncbi:major facilitator superfamily transporter [Colletotrichum graminicola]|uniref:Major facilitator superfamily transporter n=1 Tax=Colletotrichum graminicola (strain M1.001 / M2 / FGSC 10212) TaxID=645133 RepID=E3QUE3_COLGM|nr:major facilitator superfamily transporter [Colletotrichum graminicola M1.001]EFQ34481.1 major facilitator superfamily transporter [Colletotrichum graminicola M1.001]WDK08805.1 major facilitator superfamily transporter [Colletotrichum graminicola]